MNAGRNVLTALANDIYSDGRIPERRKAGKKVSQVGCPSPRALRTWIKNYERDGIAGLRDNRSRSGKKGPDLLKVEVDMLHEAAREYASSQRPSKKMIHQRLAARIREENRGRSDSGERLLRTPSRSTLERAIRKIDPLLVYAGRYGEDAALRYARTVGSGLTHLRPLQRVEIDECEMDLMVILALSGAGRALSEEERERMGLTGEKVRVWVTIAIDCATRCILAMKISLNPSQHSGLEALRMIIEDKSVWADAVGALSAWFMCGRPEEICSDNGSAYLSWAFRTAAEDLGIRVTRTVAKVPQMRGTIESIFSTIAQDLIARLTGRTFGSILERGDHPSEANAALTLDDLAFALVRWVVDIYHRRPHSGLGGRSPAQMWKALTE
ncbi:DDE-type integrase/transposase/recombinase [Paracoccus sp. AK26]|uniref:helix-turn-helix domain-containing protein n=1 Tax=Paracoccus sp. AK26 TaxID=2589076 RepID=UPI001427FD91|nr:DDE-type integrase/transposase/recombinase [Paracoccus sp. AK26]QIR85102.1 transposase family protein [Paracoccus sp. AK26]